MAVPTPYSYRSYNGDGTTVTFAVPFPYILREHVKVYEGWTIDDRLPDKVLVPVIDYEWISDTSITLKVPPAAVNPLDPAVPQGPVVLSVVRETPIKEQLSQWQAGSPPTALELNTADLQVLYAVQEYLDQVNAVSVVVVDSNEELKKLFNDLTLVVGQNSQATADATAAAAASLARAIQAEQAAQQAQASANAVNGLATAAQAAAAAAQTTADQAKTTADGIAATAATAKTTADEAKATALAAQTLASGVAGTAATAQTTADQAKATANAAQAAAVAAQNSADGVAGTATAAKNTADAAKATADQAKTTADGVSNVANTALSTAAAAETKADAAKTAADGVAGTAASALSTASSALTAASQADIKADTAKAAADAAKATADAAVKRAGDKMTGDLAVPSLNDGQLAGIRNRIINGNFLVDQRNLGAAVNLASGVPAWICDRWFGWTAGGTAAAQRMFDPAAGGDASLLEVRGGAGISGVALGHRIERANCLAFANKKVTLSASMSSSFLTSVGWQLFKANTADVFGSIPAPTKTLITSGTWAVTPTMNRYSTVIDIPAGEVTGLEIVIGVGALTAGNFRLSEVQMELGERATPYERLDFGLQVLQCQRYFVRGTAAAVYNLTGETRNISATTTFPAQMRVVPTIGGAPANILNNGNFTSLHNIAGSSWGGNIPYTAEAEV